jgi:hypothetical protein
MNPRFVPVLGGLLLGLGIILRISAITSFAERLSYVVMVLGALGMVAFWILRSRAK